MLRLVHRFVIHTAWEGTGAVDKDGVSHLKLVLTHNGPKELCEEQCQTPAAGRVVTNDLNGKGSALAVFAITFVLLAIPGLIYFVSVCR